LIRRALIEAIRGQICAEEKAKEGQIHLTALLRCKNRTIDFFTDLEKKDTFPLALWRGKTLHREIETFLKRYFKDAVIEPTMIKTFKFGSEEIWVHFTPDMITKDAVIEIKTVKRLGKYRDTVEYRPYEHDLDQLKCYMALRGVLKGYLVYYVLEKNDFTVFEINLHPNEVKTLIDFILDRLVQYLSDEIWENPVYKWECRYCGRKKVCAGCQEKSD